MFDGGVERKLWRKNYQEANSGLKITEGVCASLHSGKVLCALNPSELRGNKMKLGHRKSSSRKRVVDSHDRKRDPVKLR